jgi:hypothetical protein
MGGPVERASPVRVDDLRDICDALNDGKREYKLICDDEKTVLIIRLLSQTDSPLDFLKAGIVAQVVEMGPHFDHN